MKPEMRGALRATMRKLGLDDAAAKLLGGASAKNEMLGERNEQGAARPKVPKSRQPWFRGPGGRR